MCSVKIYISYLFRSFEEKAKMKKAQLQQEIKDLRNQMRMLVCFCIENIMNSI